MANRIDLACVNKPTNQGRIGVVHEIQYPVKQKQNMLNASIENIHVGGSGTQKWM